MVPPEMPVIPVAVERVLDERMCLDTLCSCMSDVLKEHVPLVWSCANCNGKPQTSDNVYFIGSI
jgi:hypothetical protein